MTSIKSQTEMSSTQNDFAGAPALVRKPWCTPLVIVAESRNTEGHVTSYTDGVTGGIPYGS